MSKKILTLEKECNAYYLYEGRDKMKLAHFCQEDFDEIVKIIGAKGRNLEDMQMRVDSIKFIGLKDADVDSEGYFISKDANDRCPFDFCILNPVELLTTNDVFLDGDVTFNDHWLEGFSAFRKMKAGDVKVFTRVEIRVSNVREIEEE